MLIIRSNSKFSKQKTKNKKKYDIDIEQMKRQIETQKEPSPVHCSKNLEENFELFK